MSPSRLLRIAAIAIALPLAFELSQRVSAAGGHESVPGVLWALGALSALFFLRAFVTEYAQGPEANLQKDLQWGVAIGGVLAILSRLL
jgi:hypothetical protein